MARRQNMPILKTLETLKETKEENESEEEDDIKDELSGCESEPNLDALSGSDSKIDVSESDLKRKMILQKRF